ncbi:MAG: orotate phosphoribosyltransferase [Clostridia bacterium]
MNIIAKRLFETQALEVAGEGRPFWYASGDFGPYYINTHYLYGGKDKAGKLLSYIDANVQDRKRLPVLLIREVRRNYKEDEWYRSVMDEAASMVRAMFPGRFAFVSGGERRDWFFSYVIADLIGADHLTIYKDGEIIRTRDSSVIENRDLVGEGILHVADLVTAASSYTRAWIPSLEKQGARMSHSLAMVDRNQGGMEILQENGVFAHACVTFNKELFAEALLDGIISSAQFTMISDFMDSPEDFMQTYVQNNPGFLRESYEADEKTRSRVDMYRKKTGMHTAAREGT